MSAKLFRVKTLSDNQQKTTEAQIIKGGIIERTLCHPWSPKAAGPLKCLEKEIWKSRSFHLLTSLCPCLPPCPWPSLHLCLWLWFVLFLPLSRSLWLHFFPSLPVSPSFGLSLFYSLYYSLPLSFSLQQANRLSLLFCIHSKAFPTTLPIRLPPTHRTG